MKTSEDKDSYDEWRLKKIDEIKDAYQCSLTEAVIIFLLQDISYKLSVYYKK